VPRLAEARRRSEQRRGGAKQILGKSDPRSMTSSPKKILLVCAALIAAAISAPELPAQQTQTQDPLPNAP